ncbi:Nucleotide-diphospho-sugar transferase [Dillenia turbinata]|uniref:Nucleotide-diphospho-sugar transferase n=1 Tax=Dillenia turbinata TaxID=194707 RepID=A0AAN8UKR7_9MAGN
MKGLRKLKQPNSSLLIMLLFFGGLLLYHSLTQSASTRTQFNSKTIELAEVLRRASTESSTVVLTIVNSTWAKPDSVLDLFLQSFQIGYHTKGFLNHLVIVTTDEPAFSYCKSIHQYCFDLTKEFPNSNYKMLSRRKTTLFRQVLHLGYNLIFTDADVMWFRSPLTHFVSGGDITTSCNYYTDGAGNRIERADGGIRFVWSKEKSVYFYQYADVMTHLYPNLDEQTIFESTIREMGDMRVEYVDTDYFGGFCQPSKDISKVCTMQANCCENTEKKVHNLSLLLDEWKNYTALSPERREAAESSFSWKAPKKC